MTFNRIHNHEYDARQDKTELYGTTDSFNVPIPLLRDQLNTPMNSQDAEHTFTPNELIIRSPSGIAI
jgi:hypothetical protein